MVTITVRIEEDEKLALTLLAKENDVTVSWIVRKAIKDYIAKENNKKKA